MTKYSERMHVVRLFDVQHDLHCSIFCHLHDVVL